MRPQNMGVIKTFVFLDLETSGLQAPIKITEISLVAANREHILEQHQHGAVSDENNISNVFLPRVLNKVNFTVYPMKMIQPEASEVSGLTNENLEQQKPFDERLCQMITLFLERMEKPICLVAHNGNKFDFPIFQSELSKINQSLLDDIFCADTLCGFREVLSDKQQNAKESNNLQEDNILLDIKPLDNINPCNVPKCDLSNDEYDQELIRATELAEKLVEKESSFNVEELEVKIKLEMERLRKVNENTPIRKSRTRFTTKNPHPNELGARRKIMQVKQPKLLYNMKSLYERLTGKALVNAHRAEVDSLALLECATAVGVPILDWIDRNRIPFRCIKKMW